MPSIAVVNTKNELEQALARKTKKIVITDSDIASNVKIVKTASQAGLLAAIAAAGIAATNFWNPIGWTAGLVGVVSGGTIIAALVVLGLGATLILAIYNEYDIKAGGKITLPDGTVVQGEMVLQKK